MLHKITITTKYLESVLNVEANWESRDLEDSSKWKLGQYVFKKIFPAQGTPETDLFASRVSHKNPQHMSWKLDPFIKVQDASKISWIKFTPTLSTLLI